MYARLGHDPDAAVASVLSGDAGGLEVPTSGSSGQPRLVRIATSALLASAEAAHRRLSGPGRWLLALPADHIAGAQVLLRSALAETVPVRCAPGSFTPETFLAAAAALTDTTDAGTPLYASLVPTQLHRLLASPRAVDALEGFSAVLVGGAPLGIARRVLPSAIVETYGATETSGGCVYDRTPLNGVVVEVDGDGRIVVGGGVIADGYADGDDGAFQAKDGIRWYRTPDLGTFEGGTLTILGRADDVILTGGHKVNPADVEPALQALPNVDQAAVIGIPDPEWGSRVVAVIVPSQGTPPTAAEVRVALAGSLPAYALPREIRVARSLPLLPSGKIDRAAILESEREEI